MKDNSKAFLIRFLVLLLVVAVVLSGCVRSYSQPPTQVPASKEAQATGAVEPGGAAVPEGATPGEENQPPSEPGGVTAPEGAAPQGETAPPAEPGLAPVEPGAETAPEGSAPQGETAPPAEPGMTPVQPGGAALPEGSAPQGETAPPSETGAAPVSPEAAPGAPTQPETTTALPVIQSPESEAGVGGGAPAAAAPSLVLPAEYKLQKGEFPYCIARRYNVNQSQLLKINGLSYGMLFKPGLVMKLPQTGDPWVGTRALRTHPAQYTVRSGDTFASIACYYGDVDPAAIATLNGLDPAQPLQAGQVLQIP